MNARGVVHLCSSLAHAGLAMAACARAMTSRDLCVVIDDARGVARARALGNGAPMRRFVERSVLRGSMIRRARASSPINVRPLGTYATADGTNSATVRAVGEAVAW